MNDTTHIDATAVAQLAMFTALRLLLTPYRGNSAAIDALQHELEAMRTQLIYSQSSDYKRNAFEETAKSLIEVITAQAADDPHR